MLAMVVLWFGSCLDKLQAWSPPPYPVRNNTTDFTGLRIKCDPHQNTWKAEVLKCELQCMDFIWKLIRTDELKKHSNHLSMC